MCFRFSSITINLGPTFLSGALAANADAHTHEPSCPLVQVRGRYHIPGTNIDHLQGPYRHYILNALWILINLLCIMLTLHQLRRLYRDFTTKNIEAVRIAGLFTSMLNIRTSEVSHPLIFYFFNLDIFRKKLFPHQTRLVFT